MAQPLYTGPLPPSTDPDRQALLAQLRARREAPLVAPPAGPDTTAYLAPPEAGGPPAGSAQLGVQPDTQTRSTPPGAAPAPRPTYGLEGFDAQKLQSGHDSPKYQIGRTISQFDPSQGVTDDVLAALNALGLGTFSGGKDKIRVSGNVDPRFQGVTEFDIVRGLSGQDNPAWQFAGLNGSAAAAPQALRQPMAAGPLSGAGGVAPLVPTDPAAYQTLERRIQEILGGAQTFDRDALLAQLMR